MKILRIQKTEESPEIIFNNETHIHYFRGESYPENVSEFYEPIMEWLNEYIDNLNDEKVIFNFEIIYFNSSSSKILMDIFYILDEVSEKKKNIIVNWIYDKEDDSSLEYGEEFAEDLDDLTFNLVEKI